MNRFFGMMRYSKQAIVVFVCFMIEILFVLAVAIFDVVQFALVKNNSAKLSPAFVPLNISLIILVGVTLIAVSIMFVLKIFRGKKNGFEKN